MPIRTIVLRVGDEEFNALEAKKKPGESWEKMVIREILEEKR